MRWLALAALVACSPETVVIPGEVHTLGLRVGFADIPQGELDDIISFSLRLTFNETSTTEHFLNFNSASRVLSFDPPEDLPTTGVITATLRARDVGGAQMPFGAIAGPLDLDAVTSDSDRVLRLLVSRLGGFLPLPANVALHQGRFLHSMTPTSDGRLLIVGGATAGGYASPTALADSVELLDPFGGEQCSSAGVGTCTWGDLPTPRLHHVALRLADAFDPACPHFAAVLIALGQDTVGATLSDIYLFENGTFTRLDLAVTARIGASAWATRDCRVIFAGGEGSDGMGISSADEISFEPDGTASLGAPVELHSVGRHAAVVPLGNNLEDVILLGGERYQTTPTPGWVSSDAAVRVSHEEGGFEICYLKQDEDPDGNPCNSANSSLACPRPRPIAARIQVDNLLAPTIIIGDEPDGSCQSGGSGGAEMFSLGREPLAYYKFLELEPGTEPIVSRAMGHTVTAAASGTALIAGGLVTDAAAPDALLSTSATEIFHLAALALDSTVASGTFSNSTQETSPLATARAFHAASWIEGTTFLSGGWREGGTVVSSLEVYVPVP